METYQDLEPNYPGVDGKSFKLKFEKDWAVNTNLFYRIFNLEIKVPLEFAEEFAEEFEKNLNQLFKEYENK